MPRYVYERNGLVTRRNGGKARPYSRSRVLYDYERIWNLEQKRVTEDLKKKRKRKVTFLKKKYGQPKDLPSQLEGITIANREIPATFTFEPKCYGGRGGGGGGVLSMKRRRRY